LVESFVVRIYRRYAGEPNRVVGVVEHPEQGMVERFNGTGELMKILTTATCSMETVAAPGAERNWTGAGR
jgi:hypothetical protein